MSGGGSSTKEKSDGEVSSHDDLSSSSTTIIENDDQENGVEITISIGSHKTEGTGDEKKGKKKTLELLRKLEQKDRELEQLKQQLEKEPAVVRGKKRVKKSKSKKKLEVKSSGDYSNESITSSVEYLEDVPLPEDLLADSVDQIGLQKSMIRFDQELSETDVRRLLMLRSNSDLDTNLNSSETEKDKEKQPKSPLCGNSVRLTKVPRPLSKYYMFAREKFNG
eukprot:TRINITY_DN4379_c0_g1_i2.p1 TRINITY_DN4379_c0_g1~~TRINITY_DN4379_c0_g1_i2.p1  ORF type:complete len:222 (+),score=65.85 TRINITY_DN4379_c0_g1_i2:53-718(+)